MKERWAFSKSELDNPTECRGDDELVAYVDLDDGYGGTDGQQVVVYRNGRVSDRYADGTVGISEGLMILTDMVDELLHPNGEDTEGWRDVETNKAGVFIRFLT